MQQIDIDFDVFKELTALRRSESHTYNAVLRELLNIDDVSPVHAAPPFLQAATAIGNLMKVGPTTGITFRSLFLPNGTLLRATHKGAAHGARIFDGEWVNDDGSTSTSPSAAAKSITQNTVNGWRFWQAKRPSDTEWRNLDALPKT